MTFSEHPALRLYVEELLKWNRKINLIGRGTEGNVWETHIADSMKLAEFIESDPSRTIVDIGSGGGLPAIPLAIRFPDKKFVLTETDSRKLAFLEWVIAKLKLNAEAALVTNEFRIAEPCAITSRAYGDIQRILDWQAGHAPEAKAFYLLKGNKEELVIELARCHIDRYRIEPSDKGCVLAIERGGIE